MIKPMRPRELFEALAREGVDVVVIGGLAAALHGTTRVTQHIDIAYASHRGNVERLCAVLNRLHPHAVAFGGALAPVEVRPETLRRETAFHLATDFGRVDLLRSIDGFQSYAAVKHLSAPFELAPNLSVNVLSIEGLLKAKRFLKRPKDVQDIVELEAIAAYRAAGN